MMINCENKNWEALEQNEELKAALSVAGSVEEAYEILVRYNADVTLEEVKEMIQVEQGELTEGDLDNVAGGVWRRIIGYKIVILFNPFRVKLVPIYA